jgi:hypothetical protein
LAGFELITEAYSDSYIGNLMERALSSAYVVIRETVLEMERTKGREGGE